MYLLALTEMCQRFAYWGIGNLLVSLPRNTSFILYTKKQHIFLEHTQESLLPLPILGGWIADKWNYQSPILLGTLLTAAGCFLLATFERNSHPSSTSSSCFWRRTVYPSNLLSFRKCLCKKASYPRRRLFHLLRFGQCWNLCRHDRFGLSPNS